MARHLGVSRAAVWKAVKQLESEGMCIQAATNRGYALSDAADILSPACISGYLRHPEVFAIRVEKTLDSTNRLARDLAQRGGREGTVVVRGQTAGRGRWGAVFFAGGTGVYFSGSASVSGNRSLPADDGGRRRRSPGRRRSLPGGRQRSNGSTISIWMERKSAES